MVRIGYIDRQTGSWTWCETAAATSGVKTPQRLDADDIKDEDTAAEPAQGAEDAEQHEVKMDVADAENIDPNREAPRPEGESEVKRTRVLARHSTDGGGCGAGLPAGLSCDA